jgi:hypothetical protein
MEYKNLADFMEQNGYVIRGVWYPRVTSIVQIKAKPALYKYYGDSQSYSDALSTSRRSASVGTKVHNAIEAILLGGFPEPDEETYPSIQAFQDFRKAHDIRVERGMIEQRIFHPRHRYAGTADVFAEIDGVFGILDIKTSSGVWRDYNLQTAAYLAACQEADCLAEGRLPKKPETRWILRIDQVRTCRICGARLRQKGGRDKVSGGFELCEHDWGPVRGEWELKDLNAAGDFESDFKAFLAAKTLWEWENEYWLRQIS